MNINIADELRRVRHHGYLANSMQMLGSRPYARFHERKQIEAERRIERAYGFPTGVVSIVDTAIADCREVR